MAHLAGHVAEEAGKGPGAAIGVLVGGVGAIVLGLTAYAPNGCSVTDIHVATEGVAYSCGSLTQALANPSPIWLELPGVHTIPWLAIFLAAIVGGVAGHVLSERPWG